MPDAGQFIWVIKCMLFYYGQNRSEMYETGKINIHTNHIKRSAANRIAFRFSIFERCCERTHTQFVTQNTAIVNRKLTSRKIWFYKGDTQRTHRHQKPLLRHFACKVPTQQCHQSGRRNCAPIDESCQFYVRLWFQQKNHTHDTKRDKKSTHYSNIESAIEEWEQVTHFAHDQNYPTGINRMNGFSSHTSANVCVWCAKEKCHFQINATMDTTWNRTSLLQDETFGTDNNSTLLQNWSAYRRFFIKSWCVCVFFFQQHTTMRITIVSSVKNSFTGNAIKEENKNNNTQISIVHHLITFFVRTSSIEWQ